MLWFQVCFFGLLAVQGAAQAPAYLEFKNAGAGFYGDGREDPEPVGLDSVRIGVLGPAKSREGLHQRTAILMAFEEANRKGGGYCAGQTSIPGSGHESGTGAIHRCIPYEMVFREDDGPWGVASRQVVQLAYEDKVWAIIGGLDGLHTHLAELVVSKAWVPVITPGATDSSIDYSNVPWVFRAVPADTVQINALLSHAQKSGYRHLVVLTELQRDAHTQLLRLKEIASRRHYPLELSLEYPGNNPGEVLPRLRSVSIDALVVLGGSSPALNLIRELRKVGVRVPVLGTSTLAMPEILEEDPSLGDLIVASPYDLTNADEAYRSFSLKFRQRVGEQPSLEALYSYDVARLVIEAVAKAGLNRPRIRDRLAKTRFEGLTGQISFNSLGGNPAPAVLMFLQGSHWARLE